tara:strand:- start:3414 stop:4337 length:924 start_codon:yes stop_codon:yes gene_type:complete
MLSEFDKKNILKQFPKIELSYDKINHNKVSTDYCMAIPQGRKWFAWFTCFKNKFVCILLEQGFHNKTTDIRILNCCFKNELAFGTVFYGTFIDRRLFYIEDVYYYKNSPTGMMDNQQKLTLLKTIFETELKQISYLKTDVVFGLPVIKSSYDDLYNHILQLPYKIHSIQFRNMTNKYRSVYLMRNESIARANFIVKASLQNDIYDLYYEVEKKGIMKYGTARIPTYATSIMMNKLFRTIKENDNLDRLEESDDEDEFENVDLDKFVNLNKRVTMECVYNHKFKKWIPFKISESKKIVTNREIKHMEK